MVRRLIDWESGLQALQRPEGITGPELDDIVHINQAALSGTMKRRLETLGLKLISARMPRKLQANGKRKIGTMPRIYKAVPINSPGPLLVNPKLDIDKETS